MKAEIVFPELREELRLMVDEAVARALKLGWAGGYKNVESASAYLDTSEDAIRSMVKRGQLNPVRRKPKMLFTLDELDRVATAEPEEWIT